MKPCPHCNAELRDSVIKCVHCGRSLRDEPEPVAAGSIASSPPTTRTSAPMTTARTDTTEARPSRTDTPSPWAPPRQEKLGWWSPNAGRKAADADEAPEPTGTPAPKEAPEPVAIVRAELQTRPAWTGKPDAWATAAETQERTTAPSVAAETPVDLPELRALPIERRSVRPDALMLLAGLGAIVAAAVAWQAVTEQWVGLRITDTSERLDPVFVGEMVVRGKGAVVGTIAYVLAGVIGALGVMWFLFGFDRGWAIPWYATPAAAFIAALGGLAMVVLSSTVWFVWEDAAVARARAVGKTPEKLQELLNIQPAPLVEIVRLPGLVRFGAMMALALVAASVAMAASSRRS